MQILRNFWELECLGIQSQASPERHEELLLRTLHYTDAHYEVGLPWIRDAHDLPCHLNMCFKQVKALQF